MAILAQLQRLFTPDAKKDRVQYLYLSIVEQARTPELYTELGVPDTLDGRYEMIVLHLVLVLERLKAEFADHADIKEASRLLIETYLADMDRSLREMGAGDTGIGRRVKAMASGFYGRMDAYKDAGMDADKWDEALERNVYATAKKPDASHIQSLRDYALESKSTLAACETDAILNAKPCFGRTKA